MLINDMKSRERQIGLRADTTLDESPEAMRQVRLAIARAKEGDRDALRLLYVRYSDNVYGYVRRIVRDEKEAEDLTQHVFLKLITAICKYDDRGVPFSAWLLRLARNVALDHLRRRRAIPAEEVYGADTYIDEQRPGPRAQPAHRAGLAARGTAQRRRDASRHRAHPAGDRRADGPLGELDPRSAPPRPPGAAAGAAPPGVARPRPPPRPERGSYGDLIGAPPAAHPPVPQGTATGSSHGARALRRRCRSRAWTTPTPRCSRSCWGRCAKWPSSGAFTLGHHVEAFEREFADYCETDFAVGVSSGTEALALALRALEIGPGDEVIVPTNSFIATAEAVSAVGAIPVPVDVDPDSHLITAEHVAGALGPRVRCVIPVHLFGATVDLDPILALAGEAGIDVIEDACQAHGARYRGRRVGTLGALGCFSFYPAKNLGAWGDGGAVVTSRPELADRVRLLRSHGERPRYHHRVVGSTARLDALQAAILRRKLTRLDGWNDERRRLGAALRDAAHGARGGGISRRAVMEDGRTGRIGR